MSESNANEKNEDIHTKIRNVIEMLEEKKLEKSSKVGFYCFPDWREIHASFHPHGEWDTFSHYEYKEKIYIITCAHDQGYLLLHIRRVEPILIKEQSKEEEK